MTAWLYWYLLIVVLKVQYNNSSKTVSIGLKSCSSCKMVNLGKCYKIHLIFVLIKYKSGVSFNLRSYTARFMDTL